MSAKSAKDGTHFPHKIGEVVLVKWRDGKIYFAKIKAIEWSKKRCVVIFDDKSQDLARFSWIHDVNETTTDIICVKCKQDCSDKGNEIVLCDQCGYGYHQKCHETKILQRALEDDSAWICYFCEQKMACPYVTNADVLAQSLEDIDDQRSKPNTLKPKKRKQSMKIPMENNKKFCTGLLADSPSIKQCGEEEAVEEHYMEQNTPMSAKSHKKRKSKPYKVEICSSISKEYFVDDEGDESGETPTSSLGRKIRRKNPQSQESADITPKKCCADSTGINESPSGVGIFSFEMPTEFHSNLHQLAMASQLVSQSPSGEVPHSVIRAIENEQKNHKERHKSESPPDNNREKPTSLVLSIPRSPLISISGKQSLTTPASSLVQQPLLETTPSCVATAIPSPVIVSNPNSTGKTIIAKSTPPATQAVPASPDSVFTYPNPTSSDNDVIVTPVKSISTPTIVRVDSVAESDTTFKSSVAAPVTSSEGFTKFTNSTSKPKEGSLTSVHPVLTAPVAVTQNGAYFECPPPVTMVTKPTSIQFVDKKGSNVKATPMPPKFSKVASSPAVVPIIASRSVTSSIITSVNTPTVTAASPIIMHNPSPTMVVATPTPSTSEAQPVYYVQINGATPSQLPVLLQPIRQQQNQSPVVKVVDGPMPNHTHPGSHGYQQASHVNGTTQKPTSYENKKEFHTMLFANQVKDMGTAISAKMRATYNMVSEHTLINKFEEAWNKLNELAAQWQQPKQSPVSTVTKKPTVTKAAPLAQQSSVSIGRDKVVIVAQQSQQQTQQQMPQQQQQQIPQQQQRQMPQQQRQMPRQQQMPQQQKQQQIQTLTTPVQLVPISAPRHVSTPVVHGDVVSVLPSPAHVISAPARTPVVIPAVARTGHGSDVTYYSIPPNANININPAAAPIHSHKNRDEVYMVQVVKPVAPVMPVTPVMPIRSSEKRSAAGQQCDVCSKKASFLCSGCQSAWYCGRNCQYNAWQEHSHRCNKRS